MGTYCSVAQLTARFASSSEAAFATDNEAAGVISSTVAAECIGTAEGRINSYAGKRYLIPLSATVMADTSVAELMLGITLDMAEYQVFTRGPTVPPEVVKRFERWIAWLELLKDGEVVIPGAIEIPGATTGLDASWSTWDREYATDDVRDVSRDSAGAI